MLGISMMMIADILIISMGGFAKGLGTQISVMEIMFYKSITALIGAAIWMAGTRQWHLFKTQNFKAQFFRAAIGNGNALILFWSYILLPISLAATFFYSAPIFILLQSIVFLKEKVGPFRWGAVFMGFCGIALITLPAFDPSNAEITVFAIVVGMLPAIGAASVHISIRYLATIGEPAMTTIFYFSLIGTIGSGLVLLVTGLSWPQGLEILVIGLGLAGLISQILKTVAYKYVEASLVAPFRYVGLLWSVVIGYIYWDEIPTPIMILGAAVIVSANLIIIWREATKKKRGLPKNPET